MITAYSVGISADYEDEDIEIRYSIYDKEKELCKKSIIKGYEKPVVVGLVALIELMGELEKYQDQDITIVVNDPALSEQIRGTSTSKNKHVIKMSEIARKKMDEFKNPITLVDVSNDRDKLLEWNEALKFQ